MKLKSSTKRKNKKLSQDIVEFNQYLLEANF